MAVSAGHAPVSFTQAETGGAGLLGRPAAWASTCGSTPNAAGIGSGSGAWNTTHDHAAGGHQVAVMLARLRPDVAPPSALVEHVVPADPRNVPAVVTGYCGIRLRALDLDPRFVDRLAGCVCPPCAARTPREVVMHLACVSGQLWPPEDDLGTGVEPAASFNYACGLAKLNVRHIVPEQAPRHPHSGRLTLVAECGHMAWCPVTGPWPSIHWEVCAGCLDVVTRRGTPSNCPKS